MGIVGLKAVSRITKLTVLKTMMHNIHLHLRLFWWNQLMKNKNFITNFTQLVHSASIYVLCKLFQDLAESQDKKTP